MKSQKVARTNVALRTAIVASERSQRWIARRYHIEETHLSRIVRGHEEATTHEKQKLSRFLKRPIDELFPTSSEAVQSEVSA